MLRAGRGLLALVAIVMLTVTGLLWWGNAQVIGGFTLSGALAQAKVAQSTGGAKNVLIMGLDTRKDLNGEDLPAQVLSQLHAGDGSQGGYNTNTLILAHLPADGQSITAFSIPRDDYVSLIGLQSPQRGKIKEAYGRRKAETEAELAAQGISDRRRLERAGREAARAATIATVGRLTGVPIDAFVEVSLVGFYHLSQTLGGVEVCLNSPVQDPYSGADFPAGRQHLDAAQALAFVRQRHGLDDGDLDRTHRQQAFLASSLVALREGGVLTDPVRLRNLITLAHQDVVISEGTDLEALAGRAARLLDGGLTMATLPVTGYARIDEQAVNLVDAAAIRRQVQDAFGQVAPDLPAPEAPAPTAPVAVAATTAAPAPSTLDAPAAAGPTPDTGTTIIGGRVPCVD